MRPVEMSPDKQQRVLWLHHQAFGDSACKSCPGACCVGCASAEGYFRWSKDRAAVEKLKETYNFDKVRGFKTDTGCALPVLERSEVCLGFFCGGRGWRGEGGAGGPTVRKPMQGESLKAMVNLRNHLYEMPELTEEEFQKQPGMWGGPLGT